ncbi:uncharacterized protein LOC105443295 isoform X2 [Strongylocentrotus purpuratus]|uniref:Death domain-containing protein n=1 Tax=Strongylocentrotus purpuratus TaxID=7668 RepID=A0A7M7PD55_STRPU|nr:uncharacterized protein LOC105443295 isoform X2 [Strongylocentrotus purpuratus]
MASFDPKTRLDARELDYIINQLDLRQLIRLEQNLYIHEVPFEVLERQYNENVDALSGMLFTWHSNQNPANERRLMVNALLRTCLISLAETIEMGDQHHATGNAVASNLNMGMASFDPDAPLDARELDYISKQLDVFDVIHLSRSLRIGTPVADLVRQYRENNHHACSEILNTWNSNQDPAKGRRLMIQALEDSGLTSLAETVRLGDQHHATGNAVASNLNMGMASFDLNTPLDDMELKFISRKLGLCDCIILSESLCIGTPLEDLVRQYQENKYAPSGMLFTWHSNQDPAKERSLMVKALNQSSLISLAETIRMGYQHDATGNAVASNLNMGMESFDPNTPLNARELDYISGLLSYYEFITLGQSLSIATSSQELTRQYMKNANAPSEMLNTWHSNQVPAKERRLLVKALNKSGLCSLAKIVQRGECLRTVQQGMSTDQHHASFDPNTPLDARELDHISDHLCGSDVFSLSQSLRLETRLGYRYLAIRHKENADAPREMLNTWHTNQDPAKERRLLVKALNENWLCSLAETVRMGECLRTVQQGMSTDQHHASFDPNTPLDARELDHISDHLCGSDVFSLSQSLRLETRLGYRYLAIRHKENADAPREMLNTWHTNQDPAKERRLLVKALNENWLCSLAETVRMGGWHALQLSAPYPSRPRKRTHTQTLAGHETNTPGANQPSSAFYPSHPSIQTQTQTQTLAGHETNTPGANQPSSAPYPSHPSIQTQTQTQTLAGHETNNPGANQPSSAFYPSRSCKQTQTQPLAGHETNTPGANQPSSAFYPSRPKECIFQMLLKWRNSNGVEATKEKLKKALRRSYRADLTGFIDKSDD